MTEPIPTTDPNAQTVADDDELFESIAADFSRRLRAGERPTIEQYATLHPRIAGMIRELLPTIAAVERAKVDSSSGSPVRPMLIARPERLGDFRIVREIGSGGMGIVYEAVQESLGRNVALKVLPPQMLTDERRVRRFEQEARLAARLHHTNIVPVFGVGFNEGLHYYVMQLIDGEGLDRKLINANGRSFSAIDAARIGRDVARALQFAHEQGTLHRDVKPANILVDREGHVWITDFGLAQALEADDRTTTAHVAGTLRYMPPERFNGVSAARGDVYSLGATMYELACGRTPFSGESSVELMRKITSNDPPRLRTVNPSVPRDFETIVARATAREANARYASAGELADDLQRFIDGLPIRARRVSALERGWRWCKRNRLAATALLLAVVSLTSLTIVSAVGYWRTSKLNADLAISVTRERAARASAESTSSTALEALERVFDRLAPNNSLVASFATIDSTADGASSGTSAVAIPTVSPQIAAALEDLLPYYLKLAAERGDDPSIRRQAASAMHRIGLIHARLGRFVEASDAWRRASEVVAELAAAEPADSAAFRDLTLLSAELACDLGDAEKMREHRDEARADYLLAIERLSKIQPAAATFESRRELARAHLALGQRDGRGAPPGDGRLNGGPPHDGPSGKGPPPDGPPGPPPGFGPPGPPRGAPPGPPGGPRGFGGPQPGEPPPFPGPDGGRRPPPAPEDDPPERREHLAAAFTLLSELRNERPDDAETRLLSARCFRSLAKDGPPGKREWESAEFQAATRLLRELCDDFPTVPDFAYELSETLVDFHVQELPPDDLESAGKQLHEALTISEKLVRDHPQTPAYAIANVHIYHRLAAVERAQGRRSEEEQALQKAFDGQRRIVAQFPDVYIHVAWLVRMGESLARAMAGDGRGPEAAATLHTADAALKSFAEAKPPTAGAVEARQRLQQLIDALPQVPATKK